LAMGNETKLTYSLRKLKATRWYRRAVTVGDVDMETAKRMLKEADCSVEEAEAIYRLTALNTEKERIVIPPAHREEAVEALNDPLERKQSTGFGFLSGPERGM
jgi:nitrate reductase / nitrite oxidoreductase, beta subunit